MKSNEANSNQVVGDDDFWLSVCEPSLKAIWDNCEDDIYAELLENNRVTQVVQYEQSDPV